MMAFFEWGIIGESPKLYPWPSTPVRARGLNEAFLNYLFWGRHIANTASLVPAAGYRHHTRNLCSLLGGGT